jgi:hypothetical protein
MLKTLSGLFKQTANAPKVLTVPDLVLAETELNAHIKTVDDNVAIQNADKKGVTRNKTQVRDDMTMHILDLSGPLVSLGRKTSDNDLIEEFDFSQSYLDGLTFNSIITVAGNTKTAANANLLALSGAGITITNVNTLGTDITDMNTIMSSPEIESDKKKTATSNIKKTFPKSRKLIKQSITPLMRTNFRVADPDFWSDYQNAIEIDITGRRKLAMYGRVFNEDTNANLDAALIIFKQNGAEVERAETGPKGNYREPELPVGLVDAEVSRPGFTKKTFPNLVIIAGTGLKMDFGLKAI